MRIFSENAMGIQSIIRVQVPANTLYVESVDPTLRTKIRNILSIQLEYIKKFNGAFKQPFFDLQTMLSNELLMFNNE